MKKAVVILPVIIISLVLTFAGYKLRHKKTVNHSQNREYKISAAKLFKEFQLVEMTANAKYLNQVIEVSGNVKEVLQNGDGAISVKLDAGNPQFTVNCKLSKSEKELVKQIQTDQEIVVSGICKGMSMDVILVDCKLKKESLFQF
ncbi:MAG: hypothetical protein IPP32_00355 [Bacteroidetes bacterium]|nr:hypothetical protein [Bacteroidota bacterium]